MSVGGELAFVALHGVVKFLDTVFWVFGKGLIATALAVAGLVARAILGEDARGADGARGVTGESRESRRRAKDEALSDLLSRPPDRRVSEAAKGDARKLREKHAGWCEWYAEHDVGTLLDRPKPAFETIKAHYPHAFHACTKQGFAVQLEKPGRFPALLAELRARGFQNPTRAVVEHVSFVLSHAFDRIDTRAFPFGRILRIVDMSRLDVTDTGYEAYVFLKAMAHVSSVAFPERVHKVVIVNPPAAFNVLWALFSPMVSARTMARVRICKDTSSAREALLEDLDLADIPREYGGECACGGGKAGARARDGGGARLRACPSAACSPCWRDAPLERELWDRVRASGVGTDGGVAGSVAANEVGLRRARSRRRERGETTRQDAEDADRSDREKGSSERYTKSEAASRVANATRVGSTKRANASNTHAAGERHREAKVTSGSSVRSLGGARKLSKLSKLSRSKPQSLAKRSGDVETVRASAPPMFAAPRAREKTPAPAVAETADGQSNGSWFF